MANVVRPLITTRAVSPVLSSHSISEKCGNVHAVTTLAMMSAIGMAGTDAGPEMRRSSTSELKMAYTGPASHPSRNVWAYLTAEASLD